MKYVYSQCPTVAHINQQCGYWPYSSHSRLPIADPKKARNRYLGAFFTKLYYRLTLIYL